MVSIVLKKPQEFHTNDSNPYQRGRRGGGPIIIFHRKILFSTTVHPVDLRPVCKLKFVSFGPGEEKKRSTLSVQKKLPANLIRVLIFVYQEQRAWVKWGQARSRCFGIVNGTRQGSVLSPALISIFTDDLLISLRRSVVGCHLGNVFCGAVGYADDLLLLAPSSSAMEICDGQAAKNNLEFSTDPDQTLVPPSKILSCNGLSSSNTIPKIFKYKIPAVFS